MPASARRHKRGAARARPDAKLGAELRRSLGYFNHDETCAFLGVTSGTGRNRRAAGRWPVASKVGDEDITKIDELHKYLARCRRGA